MAQADGVVANASGAAVRSDLNAQLLAIITNNSGSTAPSTTRAYQFWYDETTNQLKLRNSANDAWIVLRTIASGSDPVVDVTNGSAAATSIRPGGDADSGFVFAKDATNNNHGFSWVSGGTEYLKFHPSTSVQAQPSLTWLTTYDTGNISLYSGQNTNANGVQLTKVGTVSLARYNDGTSPGKAIVDMNFVNSGSATHSFINFAAAASTCGSITTNGSSTAYGTSSDYRLKENIVLLTDAKTRLNQLSVKRFNFIKTPDKTVDGFIAHEAQEIVPEAVTGTKDEANDDGTPKYQGIDQSKIVPLLTAALQEAFAEIAALTTRIETLEAG